MGSDRQKIIHLHGTTEPTLEILKAKGVQLGEIVVYHGEDEQALYILYDKENNNNK
jgi:hypothetical protein